MQPCNTEKWECSIHAIKQQDLIKWVSAKPRRSAEVRIKNDLVGDEIGTHVEVWIYDYELMAGTFLEEGEDVFSVDLKHMKEMGEKEELERLKNKYSQKKEE